MGANGDSGSEYDGSTRVGSTADSIRSGNERLVGGVNLQLLYHILRVIYLLSYDEDDGRRGAEMEEYAHHHPTSSALISDPANSLS